MNIGRWMAVYYALASLGEWVVVGVVIGFVYRPGPRPVAKVSPTGAGV
jgi:hypothetical protein